MGENVSGQTAKLLDQMRTLLRLNRYPRSRYHPVPTEESHAKSAMDAKDAKHPLNSIVPDLVPFLAIKCRLYIEQLRPGNWISA
jgi:hypothetical protein